MSKVNFSKLDADIAYIKNTTIVQRLILGLTSYYPNGMRYNNIELGEFHQLSPVTISHLISNLKEKGFIKILFEQSKYRIIYLNENHPTLSGIAKYHKDLHCCNQQSKMCLHCYFRTSTLPYSANSIKKSKKNKTKREREPVCVDKKPSEISTRTQVTFEEFVEHWNTHETLPKIITSTGQRKHALATRSKEPVFADNWRQIIDKLSCSPFHIGQSDGGWRADVDWLLKNDTNYVRILETPEPEFGSRIVTEDEANELMAEVQRDN